VVVEVVVVDLGVVDLEDVGVLDMDFHVIPEKPPWPMDDGKYKTLRHGYD
jgi:hypothetical protein